LSSRSEAERLCPRCAAWTGTDDRFCALCGEALRGLGLSWVLEGKPVAKREQTFRTDRIPTVLKVEVVNKGHLSVVLPTLLADPPCLMQADFQDFFEDEPLQVQLEGGASRQLDVVLDQEWLDEEPGKTRHVTLHLDGERSTEGRDGGLELTLFPKPELKAELQPDDFHLYLGPQPAEPFVIVVRAAVGSARIVGDPEFSTGKETFQVVRTEGECDLEAGIKNAGFRILFQLSPSFLKLHKDPQQDSNPQLEGNLDLQWKDPAGEVQAMFSVPITVHVRRPPTLRLGRRHKDGREGTGKQFIHNVTAGLRDTELFLQLHNAGDEELKLGPVWCGTSWATCEPFIKAKLAPGESVESPIIFTPSPSANTSQPMEVLFRVPSNDPNAPLHGRTLTILTRIHPLKEHTATVVMDFGTTASVVGIVDTKSKLLDHADGKDGIVPTLVYYATKEDILIGEKAKQQGIIDNRAIQSHIKRDLCSGQDRVIWYAKLDEEGWRSPEQVTRDFLERFLAPIQNKLKGKIADLALTHPVTFSIKQIQTLTKIARDILNVERDTISTWAEPIAGSFDFILDRFNLQLDKTTDDYGLLVYDFGGGTTDISLIEVKAQKSEDGEFISLKLLGITGDQKLGGQDLTNELINIKLGKDIDKIKRNQVFEYYDIAKIFRSEYKSGSLSTIRSQGMGKWEIDQKAKKMSATSEIDKEIKVDIPFDIVDNLCKVKIKNSIDKAKRLLTLNIAQITKLVVLPIGRSSAYPLVSELLSVAFEKSQLPCPVSIEKLEYSQLKNCVTLGVCRMLAASPNLDLSGMKVSTRSIGWLKGNQSTFEDLIPIGTPLPATPTTDAFRWKPYPLLPFRPVICIDELPDSVPLPEELPDLVKAIYHDKATRHFSKDELRGGLEVGAAFDGLGNLHLKLRAGGREVDVALDGNEP